MKGVVYGTGRLTPTVKIWLGHKDGPVVDTWAEGGTFTPIGTTDAGQDKPMAIIPRSYGMSLPSNIKDKLSASVKRFREEASEKEAEIFNKLISEHQDISLGALTTGTATGHCEPILVSVKSLLRDAGTELSELVKDGAIVLPDVPVPFSSFLHMDLTERKRC